MSLDFEQFCRFILLRLCGEFRCGVAARYALHERLRDRAGLFDEPLGPQHGHVSDDDRGRFPEDPEICEYYDQKMPENYDDRIRELQEKRPPRFLIYHQI